MGKVADLHRQQNQKTTQTAKGIQELNQNYLDRENKVNGFAGGASSILVRYTQKTCSATFGASGGGNCVGK